MARVVFSEKDLADKLRAGCRIHPENRSVKKSDSPDGNSVKKTDSTPMESVKIPDAFMIDHAKVSEILCGDNVSCGANYETQDDLCLNCETEEKKGGEHVEKRGKWVRVRGAVGGAGGGGTGSGGADTVPASDVEPNPPDEQVGGVPFTPVVSRCVLRVHCYHGTGSDQIDTDGFSIKGLLDGLALSGILPADTAQVIKKIEVIPHKVPHMIDEHTVVEIWSVKE